MVRFLLGWGVVPIKKIRSPETRDENLLVFWFLCEIRDSQIRREKRGFSFFSALAFFGKGAPERRKNERKNKETNNNLQTMDTHNTTHALDNIHYKY